MRAADMVAIRCLLGICVIVVLSENAWRPSGFGDPKHKLGFAAAWVVEVEMYASSTRVRGVVARLRYVPA